MRCPRFLWDHTYVDSSDGFKWGCLGRDSGGALLFSANGQSAFAECLSYPRGNVLGFPQFAGIIWSVNGVCHQAVNRILYAAGGLEVASARGYGLSLGLYGTYGLGTKVPWPRPIHCVSLYPIAGSGPLGGPTVAPRDDKSAQFTTSIRHLHARPDADERTIARQELEALARLKLGEDFDREKIVSVAKCQSVWREQHQHFTERLQRGELSPEGYRQVLRQAISEMAADCQRILGDKDFELLFGIPPEDAVDLLSLPTF